MKQPHIWVTFLILFVCASSFVYAADGVSTTAPSPKKLTCPSPDTVAKIKAAVLEIIPKIGIENELGGSKYKVGSAEVAKRDNIHHKTQVLGRLFNGLITCGDVNGAREVYNKIILLDPRIDTSGDFEKKSFNEYTIGSAYHYLEALEGKKAALEMLTKAPKNIRLRLLTAYANDKIRKSDFSSAWEFVELIEQDKDKPHSDKDFARCMYENYTPPKVDPYEIALAEIANNFLRKNRTIEAQQISEKISGRKLIHLLMMIAQKKLYNKEPIEEISKRLISEIEKFYENQPKDSYDYLEDKIQTLMAIKDYAAAFDAISQIGSGYVQNLNDQKKRFSYPCGTLMGSNIVTDNTPKKDFTSDYYKQEKYKRLISSLIDDGNSNEAEKYAHLSGNFDNFIAISLKKGSTEIAKYYDGLHGNNSLLAKITELIKVYLKVVGLEWPNKTLPSPPAAPVFKEYVSKNMYKHSQYSCDLKASFMGDVLEKPDSIPNDYERAKWIAETFDCMSSNL